MAVNIPDSGSLALIVRDAGMLALENFRPGVKLSSWDKSPGHPVTKSDLAVDGYLRDALGRLEPDAGWLSEESEQTVSQHRDKPMWIVDPIDGTRDFIRGRDGWAVSVAYCVGGVPQIAALYAPATDQIWLATKGLGATRDGKAIKASERDLLTGARVPADQLAQIDAMLTAVERPNSIALRIAMVADGRADLAATMRWGHAWDLAAAALIAQEAGATVSEAMGKPLLFTSSRAIHFGVLCAVRGIHADALEHLRPRAEAIAKKTKSVG